MANLSEWSARAKFERLLPDLNLDGYSQELCEQLRLAMKLMPMKDVLKKVPGETVNIKRKHIPASRNTWYSWWSGQSRPYRKQALRLQELTGIAAEKFQGRQGWR